MDAGSSTYDDKVRADQYRQAVNLLLDDAAITTMFRNNGNLVYRGEFDGATAQFFLPDFVAAHQA
jgi:ABC-type transport system substrate-binding protein